MKRRALTLGVLVGCVSVAAVFAQSDKIRLRMPPAPDQTVRLTMAQDMDIDISVDGVPAGVAPPMKMVMRTTSAMTQKVGPRKPDGLMDTEVTYEQVKTEMSLNGQSLPAGDAAAALEKTTVTVTYNQDGEIVDVKGMPTTGGLPRDAFKQMMTSFNGNLPTEPLAVGDEVTTPVNLAFPLPIPGGTPMQMTMSTKTKLVSIENGTAGRSARLEAKTDGKMSGDVPSPDGKGGMKFDFLVSGGGTTVMDLASGILRSSLITTNMNGTMNMGAAAPPGMPVMRMRATMTVTIARN